MTITIVWFLLILAPNEGAGRQVGPFANEAQCRAAERAYNQKQDRYLGPQSICVQGAIK